MRILLLGYNTFLLRHRIDKPICLTLDCGCFGYRSEWNGIYRVFARFGISKIYESIICIGHNTWLWRYKVHVQNLIEFIPHLVSLSAGISINIITYLLSTQWLLW